LREVQVEADQLLQSVAVALAADGKTLLDAPERSRIEADMATLRGLQRGDDARAIRAGIQALDETTREFAARRMDAGVKRALAGHRVEDLSGAGER
jgi:molecular chaperone HscA